MAAPKTKAKPLRRATAADLRQILGELDAATASAILATKATTAELVEVREWLDADPIIRSQLHRGASGAVAEICDILEEAELDESREH